MRALALAEQLGEIPLLALTLMTLAEYYTHTGQLAEAHRMEEQALSLASGEDQWLIARAHAMMGHILHHSGQLALAHSHFQEALSISGERALLAFPSCVAVAFDIHTLWLLGYPERALRLSRESAVELASAHFGLAWVYDATCQLDQYRRDLQAVREHVEEYRRLNAESGEGIAGWEPHAVTLSGWVDALTGRADEGIRAMRRGVAAYREMEFGLNLPYYLTVLTDGCLWAGRLEEGLAAAEEGLQEVERTRDVRHEAELRRLRGELLLGLGEDAEEVETCFRQAIAVAQAQAARSWELRATTSLARLLRDQGRIAEAREALAAIYGWFTEGFDTPDLLDARALLEELG
jgi:tetratricopeptide (TPR) repeat protein